MTSEHKPHSVQEDIAEVRDTLRANGVARYGKFERENTYGALDALERLEEQVREALSEIVHAERCVTEERKRRIGSMNMTMEGLADDLRRAREALGG